MQLSEIEIREIELIEEMNLLAAKRLMKPNLEHSRRMNQIFQELYTITNNPKYLL